MRIGEIPELKIDTMTLADRRGNPTDLEVNALVIIAGKNSILDAEVVNLIIDSIITAVDRVVRGTVLSGARMVKTERCTIRISSLRMTLMDLPYVPILLNETFITALWDRRAEKSFLSEEVYRRYFSYRPRQKTKDRVVTVQGAPCCHLDKPGLTHVLYHEIDIGDQGPVMSRPYRYDRVKQGIIDYHIQKMLKEGTIQSPYASPVLLTCKNNGLLPDSPETYRFAIDYRKFNAITKYPRYPLPLIDNLITNIPFTTIMSTLDRLKIELLPISQKS
ncbi:retrovirus-related Pol polyprotein from transposon 297 [Trichonephila clavipes]|nr:retrovirus-related Pol polyprotein from transposon 297 [Trichonephila clavipes]